MKPHKHAALIKQWADGAEVQYRAVPNYGSWLDGNNHMIWDEYAEYRIKPKDLAIKYKADYKQGVRQPEHWETPDLMLTFDSETGNLMKAEML